MVIKKIDAHNKTYEVHVSTGYLKLIKYNVYQFLAVLKKKCLWDYLLVEQSVCVFKYFFAKNWRPRTLHENVKLKNAMIVNKDVIQQETLTTHWAEFRNFHLIKLDSRKNQNKWTNVYVLQYTYFISINAKKLVIQSKCWNECIKNPSGNQPRVFKDSLPELIKTCWTIWN